MGRDPPAISDCRRSLPAASHELGPITRRFVEGQSALPPYQNGERPVFPGARLTALLGHATFLMDRLPGFAAYLDDYPRLKMPAVESFLYWSKERLASKPTIGVTHVSIVRGADPGAPDVLVAGKQIFTTRYVNTSLGITALIRGEPGHQAYLAYLNRIRRRRAGRHVWRDGAVVRSTSGKNRSGRRPARAETSAGRRPARSWRKVRIAMMVHRPVLSRADITARSESGSTVHVLP